MALQGTIKDFGLGDIFQLIGIQRKTGILTLENGSDTVTIRFVDGHVVGADMRERSVEELLGRVLVRSGRITDEQLEQALRIQRRTLKRLGHVLVDQRLIGVDDLIDGLRTQSLQIVYRLFRWRTGSFRFRSAERLDYDERHFLPISADTILMEGARMIDEWPIIERRVRSERTVFRRLPAADAVWASPDAIGDQAPGDASTSRDERTVLELVDGARTVGEICDRSTVGEFDTWRVLADLARRGLIGEATMPSLAAAMPLGRGWLGSAVEVILCGAILALAGMSFVADRRGPAVPWSAFGSSTTQDLLRSHASQVRIERIERAIRLFYLDRGSFPARLDALAGTPYLAAEDLVDPWGRRFVYQLDPGGFRLFALTADGLADPERTLSHRFTTLQRTMRAGAPTVVPPEP
jgi:Domain of unknown function (DUF4388)/Type II secretion system (T2SS), protein G